MLSGFRLRLLWFFLAFLAAFVLFAEFLVVGGGRADPIPKPLQPLPTHTSSPAARTFSDETTTLVDLRPGAYFAASSSNTNSPLS